jgi:CRISPR-associated protein Cas2
MHTVVSYDISNDRRRTKVMKIIEGYGYRVQYSVFECELDARKMAELRSKLKPLVRETEQDSIRFYPLSGECADKVQVLGRETAYYLEPLVIIGEET